MLKSLKRWWRYLGTRIGMQLDQSADAKVQLEQAIQEARDQHRRLAENAASVVAHQIHLQQRLDAALAEYDKANNLTRQALVLADREAEKGETAQAVNLNLAAESFTERIVFLEREIGDLKRFLLESAEASARARHAVRLNAEGLRTKVAQREYLLSQLDQAKVQEQLNTAMSQLSQGPSDEVPSLDQVRDTIERRLAAARATSEVRGTAVSIQVLEVEQALQAAETQARLGQMRTQLGLAKPQTAGMIESSSPATKAASAN